MIRIVTVDWNFSLTRCKFNDCGASGTFSTSFFTWTSLHSAKFTTIISFNFVELLAAHSVIVSMGNCVRLRKILDLFIEFFFFGKYVLNNKWVKNHKCDTVAMWLKIITQKGRVSIVTGAICLWFCFVVFLKKDT